MYAPQTRLFDLPLCVVDVETTGATFDYGDRVVELRFPLLHPRGDRLDLVLRTHQGVLFAAFLEQQLGAGAVLHGVGEALRGAVNTFLDDPQSLTISAEPENPVPFAMLIGAGMTDPQRLTDVLGLEVWANR